MTCPCCRREMETGYLQAGNRIAWTKSVHKISLLPREGEILLANHVFAGANFTAYICKPCKKIVVDYGDRQVEEG